MTGIICCTLNCNLACEYCYEGNGNCKEYPNIKQINDDFELAIPHIIKFIDELVDYNCGNMTKIIFHGGEPTLIKPELLEKIIEDQNDKCHKINWTIQSNGTLITPHYIELLKKHKITIGISMDGLKQHHDKYRKFKNGNPTFDVIVENIKTMLNNGIRCATLVTITNENVDNLIEIYKFFANMKLNFNFNALFPEISFSTAELSDHNFADKICDLFDYWINDNETKIMISPFEVIMEGLLNTNHRVPACHWVDNCSKSFVAIDTKGNLYPCEHWVNNSDFLIGNIQNGLKNSLENNRFFENRVELLKSSDCKNCDIFDLCYGGCPWNAWSLYNDCNKKDASICIGRKKLIKHIKDYMSNYGLID